MNVIILAGHLGRDPEIKYGQDGKAVAVFSLATRGFKKDSTDWHRVVAFGKTAELVAGYLSKGSHIALEGTLSYNTWENKDGQKITQANVIANRVEFLSKKSEQQEERPESSGEIPPEDIPF
jgi:single-strand DNA-binding protein